MDKLLVVKIGGNIIDDAEKLASFLHEFALLPYRKILVHGGGKLATDLAQKTGIPQQMVEGRRITDAETLKVVTMVYAGAINKNIVAQLQSKGVGALGLTGADGNAVRAHKRINANLDYGFVGDVDDVNTSLFKVLLQNNLTPVVAPITHDGLGQLLNTNADTVAQEIAKALSAHFLVSLVYSFEKEGVMLDVNDAGSVISSLNADYYDTLKENGSIFAGMIPKLDNAFAAVSSGVDKVIIGNAMHLSSLIEGTKGTTISHARQQL